MASELHQECMALVNNNVKPQDVVNVAIALSMGVAILERAFPRMPHDMRVQLYNGESSFRFIDGRYTVLHAY